MTSPTDDFLYNELKNKKNRTALEDEELRIWTLVREGKLSVSEAQRQLQAAAHA